VDPLLILALAGVASYGLRASFIATAGAFALPASVDRLLRYARPAILAALVATSLARSAEGSGMPLVPVEVLAAAVAGYVAWRTRNLLWTLLAGLGVLVALEAAASLFA
jgi:branched-subunit amino acid transport protein